MKSKLYIYLFFILMPLNLGLNISASSLGGPSSYFAYEPYHHVFYDRESAVGFVRLGNGFTVTKKASGAGSTHGSIMLMDTNLSVSGAIDLRDTNTLFLQQDLRLENGVTFSSSGNIYGYDKALILDGDVQIPANKVMHIGGRIVIEGNGHTLKLNDNAQLFVDTGATVTLRNLNFQNSKNFAGNPAIKLSSIGSYLTLDNSILNIVGDFYFDRGSLFFYNDVAFTGTSAFIYRSSWPSYITSGATLNFDIGTTLDFRPSTTGSPQQNPKDLIVMSDPTSQLFLNGATLKATTTGVRLTKGRLLLDNVVSLTNQTQFDINGFNNSGNPIATSASYGGVIYSLGWSPDGRYVAVGGASATVNVYKFTGSGFNLVATSASYGGQINAIDWSPDGKYVAAGGATTNKIYVYSFTGSALTLVATSATYAAVDIISLKWNPDGRYIAIGGSNNPPLEVHQFTGSSLALVARSAVFGASAASMTSISWHPSGNYIAVGSEATSASYKAVNIYSFTGRSATLLVSRLQGSNSVYSVAFSPDGNYVAFGVETANSVGVYQFTGSSLVTAVVSPISYGGVPYTISWTPCGRYLAVGGDGAQNVKIYQLMNGVLTLVGTSAGYGGVVYGVAWSSDCRYVLAGGAGALTAKVFEPKPIYPTGASQCISNTIVFGNSALGASYDLNVKLMSSANVEVDGLINIDNVN